MKTMMMGALALAVFIFAACNQTDSKTTEVQTTVAAGADKTDLPQPAAGATAMKTVVASYLEIKNGLAADQPEKAASAGTAMAAALAAVDPSAFTPEQTKIYKENEEDLKEHATHIGKNGGNMEHQREHFVQMSEDVYALVKAFGGGRPLYYDHCAMYDNNKGASWLSETKEISNPYMGAKMPGCGSVKEVIQ